MKAIVNNSLAEGILEGTTDLVAAIDPGFHYVAFNSAYAQEFERIFGTRIELGMTILDALAHVPEDLRTLREFWGRALTGETFTITRDFRRHGSGRHVYELKYHPLRSDQGSITGAFAIIRDIADREQLYREIVQTANEGIWVLDTEGRTTFVNYRLIEMFRYSETEMMGRPLTDFMDDDAAREAVINLGRRRAGIREQHNFCFRRKDGTPLFAIVSTGPMYDPDGRYSGALGMITDVTDRHWEEQDRGFLLSLSDALVRESDADMLALSALRALISRLSASRGYLMEGQTIVADYAAAASSASPSSIAVPIRRAGRIAASLNVEIPRSDWTDRELRLVREVAERLWTFFESARLVERLRESESRYRIMTEASPIGVLLGDIDGRIREANSALLKMIGRTQAELPGLRWDAITPQEWLPVDEARIAEAREHGVCTPYQKEYIHSDGHRIPILVGFALTGEERRESAAFIVDLTELKRAERELSVSEGQLLLAQSTAGFGTWDRDLQTGRTILSESCLSLHGMQRTPNLSFRQLIKHVEPADRKRFLQTIKAAMAGSGALDMDYRVPLPDGAVRWLAARGRILRDESGKPIRFTCISFDITEKKRVAQENQRLAAVLEQSNDFVGLADNRGQPIYVNPAGLRLVGLNSVDEVRRTTIPDYFPQEDRAYLNDVILPYAFAEGSWTGEFRFRNFRTGAVIPVEFNVFAVRDSVSGEFIGVATVTHDITERKRAEEALRASERNFRELAEAVPEMVWTSSPSGSVEYFNSRWYAYTGQAEQDACGWGWSAAMHPEDAAGALERWKRSLETGDDYELEYRFRRSDGVYRWFLGRGVAMRNASGDIVKWYGTCTDIDDQKRTEKALRRSNEDLQQFAWVASHDLQEPLRTVASFTQLLERRFGGRMGSEADDYIRFVVDAANRMSQLIRDLLAYSTATNEHQRVVQTVDCEAIVRTAVAWLSAAITEKGAAVTYGRLPQVDGDPGQLAQVFQNLIGNALKYSNPNEAPRVRVRAHKEEDTWVFAIEDNGIGFARDHAERIFGMFKRLHGRDTPGTGIGLPIARTIIERHGGRMWAESEPNRGSTFWFTLPARVRESEN